MKNKRQIFDGIRIVVLLFAVSILLYPTVSNYLYEKNCSKVISEYDEEAVRLSRVQQEKMLQEARQYNKELLREIRLSDPFSPSEAERNERYEGLLNMNQGGMMGHISIPRIRVKLPIYHGTSESVLQAGAGHLAGTSLPVGGESTHTVLTGHRGIPTKELFTDLDQLNTGDIFYIKVFGETLAYKVDQILTVRPDDTKELTIVPQMDYATLVTCTPYAVNTHRLLIRGYRVPYEEAAAQVPENAEKGMYLSFEEKILLAGIGIVLAGLLLWKLGKSIKKRDSRYE